MSSVGRGRRWAAAAVAVTALLGFATGCGADAEAPAAAPVISDATINDARYQCLLDAGFPVTRGAAGEVKFADPDDERTAAFTAADRRCEQSLADRGLLVVASPEALRTEWAAMSELHGCLVGHDFPLVDWPSETVYVEKAGAFNVLKGTAPIDQERARAACPDAFAKVELR